MKSDVVGTGPAPAVVRAAVAKVLASAVFAGSERLSQFLHFVVEETLEGRGDRIKDYVVGVEVYHKSASYDPRTDSSVRTEASRLRSKLSRYYETDGLNDDVIISMPKGGYVAAFAPRQPEPIDSQTDSSRRPPRSAAPLGIALLVVTLGCAVWALRPRAAVPNLLPELVPLTAYPGYERTPSFSPDGTQVAFSWDGGVREGNENIYVKVVGSDDPLRLTNTRAREFSPAWSPDGRLIAFLRFLGAGRAEIVAVPALGGSERKLGETRSILTPGFFPGHQLAWSPDGKWLSFADRGETEDSRGLFLLSTITGEKRRLTTVPSNPVQDRGPAFSPNGRWLAFCRVESLGVSDIYLLGLSPAYLAEGEPRRLTSDRVRTTAVSWMPNSQEIVFSSGSFESDRAIFRMNISRANQAEAKQLIRSGEDAYDVAIAPGGRRLAYTKRLQDLNIWRVELSGGHGSSSRSFIASTRNEHTASISPDGKHVAFSSSRSGTREIWIANADGSNAMQLTAMGGRLTTNPAWSPDGQELAFDSRLGGTPRIFVVSVRGGAPHQLTSDPNEQLSPAWSQDGKSIYYHSGPATKTDVWKLARAGGAPTRITRQGGTLPKESPDGKTVYYAKDERLWQVPAAGGREERVCSEPVDEYNFAVTGKGIYFIPAAGTPLRYSIRVLRFTTGKVDNVIRLEKPPGLGLTVSPDESWLLYSQYDQEGSDLMLMENFR